MIRLTSSADRSMPSRSKTRFAILKRADGLRFALTLFALVITPSSVYGQAPVITSVSPASGPVGGGTAVTIIGTGFTGATELDFGSTAANFEVVSDTHINATTPAGTAGPVAVSVTNSCGEGQFRLVRLHNG